MQRRSPLQRRTSLASTSKLERSPLKQTRRRPLKTRHRNVIDRQASEAWARGVRAKRCVRCGAAGVQGHHIITQQAIRRRARELGVDAQPWLWDKRNRLAVCPRCHAAHHAWAKRIDRELVLAYAPKVLQFARELGLEWLFDREYPEARAA